VDELDRLLKAGRPLDLTDASRVLRLLILDGPGLLISIAAARGIPCIFSVAYPGPYPSPGTIWGVEGDGLDPRNPLASNPTRELGVDDFLRTPIGQNREFVVTVRDLIRLYAHVLGGVHAGRPRAEEIAVWEAFVEGAGIRMSGHHPMSSSLRAIGRIVIAAAEPLVEQIREERRALGWGW